MREPNNNNEELDRGQNSGGREGTDVSVKKSKLPLILAVASAIAIGIAIALLA